MGVVVARILLQIRKVVELGSIGEAGAMVHPRWRCVARCSLLVLTFCCLQDLIFGEDLGA